MEHLSFEIDMDGNAFRATKERWEPFAKRRSDLYAPAGPQRARRIVELERMRGGLGGVCVFSQRSCAELGV